MPNPQEIVSNTKSRVTGLVSTKLLQPLTSLARRALVLKARFVPPITTPSIITSPNGILPIASIRNDVHLSSFVSLTSPQDVDITSSTVMDLNDLSPTSSNLKKPSDTSNNILLDISTTTVPTVSTSVKSNPTMIFATRAIKTGGGNFVRLNLKKQWAYVEKFINMCFSVFIYNFYVFPLFCRDKRTPAMLAAGNVGVNARGGGKLSRLARQRQYRLLKQQAQLVTRHQVELCN